MMASPEQNTLQRITSQLVQRGWQRSWADVHTPCWYLLSDGEADGARPTLRPCAAETLAIWPDRPWFLLVHFSPHGLFLRAEVVVHDSPGDCVEGEPGSIPEYPGDPDGLLAWAEQIYRLWERWANRPLAGEAD
ncbi:hypothetical protein [Synechococcus sp. HK01-R]|uniref:hypothetical protein n=1 Tax=Synechococcus sp. HK01-R TaxID=2751171 RepID=UPI00162411A4|nr:hypothetical protein [Synechococcus sp. HK01-R]QNG26097.1 hypothetical protein H0O21_07195 [Synechococcus sp. HK01-R]